MEGIQKTNVPRAKRDVCVKTLYCIGCVAHDEVSRQESIPLAIQLRERTGAFSSASGGSLLYPDLVLEFRHIETGAPVANPDLLHFR